MTSLPESDGKGLVLFSFEPGASPFDYFLKGVRAFEGVWEHLGRSLKKGSKKEPFFNLYASHVGDLFRQCGRKRGHEKISVFWDPL